MKLYVYPTESIMLRQCESGQAPLVGRLAAVSEGRTVGIPSPRSLP
jgi:hypothetical protein